MQEIKKSKAKTKYFERMKIFNQRKYVFSILQFSTVDNSELRTMTSRHDQFSKSNTVKAKLEDFQEEICQFLF